MSSDLIELLWVPSIFVMGPSGGARIEELGSAEAEPNETFPR
jgi:hypothetical protein